MTKVEKTVENVLLEANITVSLGQTSVVQRKENAKELRGVQRDLQAPIAFSAIRACLAFNSIICRARSETVSNP